MTHIHHVHHVGLTITDLDTSVDFYTQHLGCTEVMRQEKQGGYLAAIVGYRDAHVRMAHLKTADGGLVIELFEYLSPDMVEVDLEPRVVGNPHLCFVVDDLAEVHAGLESSGVHFFSDPVLVDTGANAGGWGAYLRDPDGIVVELFQPAARTSARSQGPA